MKKKFVALTLSSLFLISNVFYVFATDISDSLDIQQTVKGQNDMGLAIAPVT